MNPRRILIILGAVGCLLFSAALAIGLPPLARLSEADASLWMITPKAPARTAAERIAELTARRAAVLKAMGQDDVLILYAAEPRVFSNDVDYPYRQENNLYYLTEINQAGAVLIMSPSATPNTILYMPVPDPSQESWTGHELSASEVRALCGIQEVRDAAQVNAVLDYLAPGTSAALADDEARGAIGRGDRGPDAGAWTGLESVKTAIANSQAHIDLMVGDDRHYPDEVKLTRALKTARPTLTLQNAAPLFAPLRNIKSPWEISLLQHAVDISAESHMRAWALTSPGVWEYQIRGEIEATYGARHADDDGWGYPEIVASGDNATTLHYETDQEQIPAKGLVLIDAAAMYGHYSADVTRTYPINGKFTPEEADIYRLVWQAQKAMIDAIKPGGAAVGALANQTFVEGLKRLGLITIAPGAPTDAQQLAIWYFHGPSHAIGLDVHDVGGITLRPGLALTMEPALYFRPRVFEEDLPTNNAAAWKIFTDNVRPVFEKYKGIGVRIEDDVLVTDSGAKVLSGDIPSKLEDVEARIAALRAWVKKNGSAPTLLP